MPGKEGWLTQGLPSEGSIADDPTAGSVARRDAPTCRLDEQLGRIRERLGTTTVCIVVNEATVVVGILRSEQLEGPDDRTAEEAMRPGPSTFRPNVAIGEMVEWMTKHQLDNVPVTSADGTLIGVLFGDDAEHAAHG